MAEERIYEVEIMVEAVLRQVVKVTAQDQIQAQRRGIDKIDVTGWQVVSLFDETREIKVKEQK